HVVADDAILADGEGKARIGVQHRVVLDLGALAQLDPLVVPAQHRVEPNAGVGLEPHAPNDDGTLGDPITAIRRQLRRLAVKLEDCHSRPPLSEAATLPCGATVSEAPPRRFARSARANTECPQPYDHARARNQAPAAGDGKGDRKREDVTPLCRHEPYPFSRRDLSHGATRARHNILNQGLISRSVVAAIALRTSGHSEA